MVFDPSQSATETNPIRIFRADVEFLSNVGLQHAVDKNILSSSSTIEFLASCTQCETCARVCPVGAIGSDHGGEPTNGGERVTVGGNETPCGRGANAVN